jgi:hypothetical protein
MFDPETSSAGLTVLRTQDTWSSLSLRIALAEKHFWNSSGTGCHLPVTQLLITNPILTYQSTSNYYTIAISLGKHYFELLLYISWITHNH